MVSDCVLSLHEGPYILEVLRRLWVEFWWHFGVVYRMSIYVDQSKTVFSGINGGINSVLASIFVRFEKDPVDSANLVFSSPPANPPPLLLSVSRPHCCYEKKL